MRLELIEAKLVMLDRRDYFKYRVGDRRDVLGEPTGNRPSPRIRPGVHEGVHLYPTRAQPIVTPNPTFTLNANPDLDTDPNPDLDPDLDPDLNPNLNPGPDSDVGTNTDTLSQSTLYDFKININTCPDPDPNIDPDHECSPKTDADTDPNPERIL